MSLRIFVVVATVGRPDVVRQTVDRLALQTRAPDGVLVVSVNASDVEGLDSIPNPPEIAFAERGLCKQRNRSLELLKGRADVVVFFDDDFVPCVDFMAEVDALFSERADVSGLTGRLIADGVLVDGYTFDEAVAFIEADVRPPISEMPVEALYGCNMCIRVTSVPDLRFDEALPLYGWQEDIDFTYQLGRHGKLLKSTRLSGVHMGSKGGRSPGKRLGYSQIANPIYLLRKQTMPKDLAYRLMRRNVLANVLKSFRPEPNVDRRGRALGNLFALRDLALGNLHPANILSFR